MAFHGENKTEISYHFPNLIFVLKLLEFLVTTPSTKLPLTSLPLWAATGECQGKSNEWGSGLNGVSPHFLLAGLLEINFSVALVWGGVWMRQLLGSLEWRGGQLSSLMLIRKGWACASLFCV